ncbi:MAG: hypothetical protein LBP64_08040 [Tannerella sp.]|nr:hypothetical protein [Tannerella sp.]
MKHGKHDRTAHNRKPLYSRAESTAHRMTAKGSMETDGADRLRDMVDGNMRTGHLPFFHAHVAVVRNYCSLFINRFDRLVFFNFDFFFVFSRK